MVSSTCMRDRRSSRRRETGCSTAPPPRKVLNTLQFASRRSRPTASTATVSDSAHAQFSASARLMSDMKRLVVVMLFTAVAASAQTFPNWSERVILEWINRARVDPQVEMAACGAACSEHACYSAIAPLMWIEQLNRSARFHAAEMAKQQYFGHDSKC